MKFKMSTNIAVRTVQFSEAVNFYSKVLGFPNRSKNAELADLDADPLTIFMDDDREFVGPILELFVDDLDSARDYLIENGCKVVRWRGKGKDCYIQDPYGVIFNLWQEWDT